MQGRLGFKGNLSTTAMGIMPHEDIDRALGLALALDIPFWPQLPRLSFYEDMYVQAMEGFPGVIIDEEKGKIYIDTRRFLDGIPEYLEEEGDSDRFSLSERYSLVYRHFLSADLTDFKAIRGQIISPVSLTLKITDENNMPIVYNDDIRSVAFSFIQTKLNRQYEELTKKNKNAFVWIDDPGLEFIFNAMCGYDSIKAKKELDIFFEGVRGPRGVHLCGRPDWDFLLSLDIDIISFNTYAEGDVFVSYKKAVDFLRRGRMISWGIVPTFFEDFSREDVESIAKRLVGHWKKLIDNGVELEKILENSILAPATCNLINPDKTLTVEKSFALLREVSVYLKSRYNIT
ncbi:MAG TPA: hypothetical protein PLM23_00600 [Syntrophorhabdaceae bacterium]|nr:hypothetical protein [Syntrophorhabdaceae bacterium]HPP41004.1 hypothetical protein [Syntrophorhabdaceae bacterium]